MNTEPHMHTVTIGRVYGSVFYRWYVQYGNTQVTIGRSENGDYLSPRLVKRVRSATLRAIRLHDEGSKKAKELVDPISAAQRINSALGLVAYPGQWASERIAAEKER